MSVALDLQPLHCVPAPCRAHISSHPALSVRVPYPIISHSASAHTRSTVHVRVAAVAESTLVRDPLYICSMVVLGSICYHAHLHT